MSHDPPNDGGHRPGNGFWTGKRVLVTGHTGFKGGWLSLWLQALGADVVGYALPPATEPALFAVADVGRDVTSHMGDIRDRDRLAEVVNREAPDVVFHLAAQPLVRRSYRAPVETFETNVMGTAHLLDAVRAIREVRAVVCVTSDKCYGESAADRPFREDDPMGGVDPYSASKGCSELVASSYRRSYFAPDEIDRHGVALATARAGNVIGGGDWSEDRLVVDVVTAFARGEPVHIRSPAAVRPWQHVLDPLAGYMVLAERLWRDRAAFAEAWNFGPQPRDVKSVGWIVDELAGLWGGGTSWEGDPGPHPHESPSLVLDASKAHERLGWAPKLPIDEALAWTVEWYQRFGQGHDMRDVTLQQIASYERL